MILTITEFGGVVPKIKDPARLPHNKSQVARNCRFDQGGLIPLYTDLQIEAARESAISLFVYYNLGLKYYFQWTTDVDAVETPLANDSWNRVFYTENGKLRVTDNVLFNQGGMDYPMASLNPCPPAPATPILPSGTAKSAVVSVSIVDSATIEADGHYNLVFSGGGGSGAAGTYDVAGGIIIQVTLTSGGIDYTSAPTVHTQTSTGLLTAHLLDATFIETRAYVYTFVNKYGQEGPPSIPSRFVNVYDGNDVSLADIGVPQDITTLKFSNGTLNFVGKEISNLSGTATATVIGVELDSGTSFESGNASGTAYLQSWNGNPFDSSIYIIIYVFIIPIPLTVAQLEEQPTALVPQDLSDYAITTQRIYRINQTASGTAQYQFVEELPIGISTYIDEKLDADLGEVLQSLEWDAPPAGVTGLIALPNGMLACFVGKTVCISVPKYPHAWKVADQKTTDTPVVSLSSFGMSIVVLTEGVPYLIIGDDSGNMAMQKVEGLSCIEKRSTAVGDQFTLYASPEGLSAIGPSVSKVVTQILMTKQDWNERYNPTSLLGCFWESKYIGFYYPLTGDPAGFMLDVATGDLIDLDFHAVAQYQDKRDGTLYLIVGGNIVAFNQGTTYRTLEYVSKLYRYRTNVFGCAKIIASEYPVQADIIYPSKVKPAASVIHVEDSQPIRLSGFMTEACEIKVHGNKQISIIHVANTIDELPE